MNALERYELDDEIDYFFETQEWLYDFAWEDE